MAANLYKAPTTNYVSTSLDGAINSSVDTLTLNSTTGLQAPGYLIIDRQDGNGVNTPSSREVVYYTAISGSDVTTVTRGADNSTAASHSDGALVEPILTAGMWNSQQDFLAVSLATVDGTLRPVSTATITNLALTTSYSPWVTESDGATITFDLDSGNKQLVVLGGNRTLALSNVNVGQSFILKLTQDGTGSRTVTWFSTISWAGGSAPTLTATLNKSDTFGFICTGADTYDGFVVGQNI